MALAGEVISTEVVRQLQAREEVYSLRNNDSTLRYRNDKDLFYLNSSNSWLRLISGADVKDENGNYDSTRAREFVLWGGESRYNKNSNSWNREGGINFTDNTSSRKTYNYDESLGVRPQSGLTSFTIASRNRFGSIRQAEIGFKVWTKNDLSKAQTLFLKPGVSVIVEWGVSPYLDNSGNLVDYNFKGSNLSSFFTTNRFQTILDLIQQEREATFFNYDGFLGLVSNFSFSLTQDGGYDCTLTIVSQGTVLESLTTQTPSTFIPVLKEENPRHDKTKLHRFLYSFESLELKAQQKKLTETTKPITLDTKGLLEEIRVELEEELVTENIPRNKALFVPGFFTRVDAYFGNLIGGESQYVWYITVRNFLAICNLSFSKINSNGERLGGTSFNLDGGAKYNTFNNHFSFNPLISILPTIPSQDELQEVRVNIQDKGEKIDIHGLINRNVIFDVDDIMEIRVATPYLIKVLEEFYNQYPDPGEANVLDYVKNVFKGIQEALGDINDFDVYFDEDINQFRVVDREINPYFSQEQPNIPVVNVTGLNSQVLNLEIKSKISSELSSMIAIASQASDTTSLNKSNSYIKWMGDTRSRFTFNNVNNKLTAETDRSKEQNEQDRFNEFIDSINKAYKEFNGVGNRNRGYDTELFDAIKYEGFKRTRAAIIDYKQSQGLTNGSLIPIEISIKLNGISGVKIGQVFQISNTSNPSPILPDQYNEYGFIITKLNHSIENNKWYTELGGILFNSKVGEKVRINNAGNYKPLES